MTLGSDRRDPFTLRFADPRLEAEYERDVGAADRRRLRVASVSGIAIWVVAALVGPPLLDVDRVPVTIAAISVSAMNLFSLTLLHSRPTTLRTQRRLLLAVGQLPAVVTELEQTNDTGAPSQPPATAPTSLRSSYRTGLTASTGSAASGLPENGDRLPHS